MENPGVFSEAIKVNPPSPKPANCGHKMLLPMSLSLKIFFAPIVFLALSLCVLPAAQNEATNPPAVAVNTNSTVVPTLRIDRHEDMQRKLERFAGKHFDIVFDGDSIMNRWETTGKEIWNQRYAGRAADFGIEGDRVENVLWRVSQGQLKNIHPKVVVLMIGTNNSGRNSATQIADGIARLVSEYEDVCPEAHIILMGIFPRGEKPEDGGRKKVAAVNSLIQKLGEESRVTYIDISSKMIEPDGTISHDMMPDYVHPTAKGYQIWADAIQPEIDKIIPAK